jgi:tubulin polyglutamylase TTLL9
MATGCLTGKKFDMRVYALVTSYAPLTVWLYRTGFGRFSNTRYTVDRENVDNLCAFPVFALAELSPLFHGLFGCVPTPQTCT